MELFKLACRRKEKNEKAGHENGVHTQKVPYLPILLEVPSKREFRDTNQRKEQYSGSISTIKTLQKPPEGLR